MDRQEKIIKILEVQYQSFKDKEHPLDYFVGLADYLKIVKETSELANITKSLERQEVQANKMLQRYNSETIKELNDVGNKLVKEIGRLKINLSDVNLVIKEMNEYLEGKIWTSAETAHQLDSYLFGIARKLKENGYLKLIEKYIDDDKPIKNIYGNFTFSKKLKFRNEEREHLKDKTKTKIWGAWSGLPMIYRLFHEADKTEEILEKKPNQIKGWDLPSFRMYRQEFNAMVKDDYEDLVFFDPKKQGARVDRIHAYLIKELLLGKPREIKEVNEINNIKPAIHSKLKPYLKTDKKDNGYLKLYKEATKIFVGNIRTRKYRLLKTFLDEPTVARTIESVFENIKLSRDDKDSRLKNEHSANNRKLQIIQSIVKEFQRLPNLKSKISLGHDPHSRSIWLELKL